MAMYNEDQWQMRHAQLVKEQIEAVEARMLKTLDERFQQMEERGTVGPQDVRLACAKIAAEHLPPGYHDRARVNYAAALADFVLNGDRPAKAAAPTDDISALKALTPTSEAQPAPDSIVLSGDHMIWTVAIGNDHTAMIFMHQDDYAVLTGKKPGEA